MSFWCYLRFSLEKPPAGSQAASGKGVYTTQGGVSQVGLFHYAFEIIDDALKAFGPEEPGFAVSCVGLNLVLVYQAVQHTWVNPVLFRKRRGAD